MILILSSPGQFLRQTDEGDSQLRLRIGGCSNIEKLKSRLRTLGIEYGEESILGTAFLKIESDADHFHQVADEDEEIRAAFRESMQGYLGHSSQIPPQLKLRDIKGRPAIMGILNVTPDSFSDGGLFQDRERAVRHALDMIDSGADIIDVGGESTRPGSSPVSAEQEMKRVIPVIRAIAGKSAVPISVDTMKPEVATAAIAAGAAMVNDVGGLALSEMRRVVAENGSAAVIMHMKGEPRTMQINPTYNDVVAEISMFFSERLRLAAEAGIDATSIMIDPGVGFGKSVTHNLQLLSELDAFRCLGRPVLLGASRKSFISVLTGEKQGGRLQGSLAAALFGWMKGVAMLRVHDVPETARFIRVWKSIADGMSSI